MLRALFILIGVIIFIVFATYFSISKQPPKVSYISKSLISNTPAVPPNSLSIVSMRQRSYPGSQITIEQMLSDGNNYHQYIASYKSDGLKIYALLTVPIGEKPKNGWPIIVFNHGYIPPGIYQTTERYIAYVDAFARNGYVVFKPDYRGNGNSEGKPEGAYYSNAYAVDDLNAIASIKKYTDVNAKKLGVWGHSMGGNITLRDLVVDSKDIHVAVIWGGVVGSYADLMRWHDPTYHPSDQEMALRNKYRSNMVKLYGTPESNPTFWNSIDPTNFISDITAPIQLDVGGADGEVPPKFSQNLRDKLKKAGKTVEYFEYSGADHNISQSLDIALQNSVNFFDKYLK